MPEPTPPAAKAPGEEAPFGTSPVTGPTPNRGFEAAALQRVGSIVKELSEILALAGPTSDLGRDVMNVLPKLAKHVPPGSVTPASEKSQLERRAMQNAQNNQQMQALRQQNMPRTPQLPKPAQMPAPAGAGAAA